MTVTEPRMPPGKDVEALLAELQALGIHLWVEKGNLAFEAPVGVFSDALKERVRKAKPLLIARLSPPPAETTESPTAPLSANQARMWFLRRAVASDHLYLERAALYLKGDLDRPALEEALTRLLSRHAVLRTVFRDGEDGPEQVVMPPVPVRLPPTDLTTLPEAERDAGLRRFMEDTASRPLDLEQGPVIRLALARWDARFHVLSVVIHHAAWDGWSNGVFQRDLATTYDALHQGREPQLPPPSSYADFARRQRREMATAVFAERLESWRRLLADMPTLLSLPTDHPRPETWDPRSAWLPFRLPAPAATRLVKAGGRVNASPFMVLLAAYAVLLARLAGQRRMLVGVPVSARVRPDLEGVVGYVSNTVPVRLDLEGAATFAAVVERVRDGVLEAMTYQDVPLDKLIEVLNPPRPRDRQPLFQTLFTLQPVRQGPPSWDGVEVIHLEEPPGSTLHDLALELAMTEDGAISGRIIFPAALLETATVGGWRDAYAALLERGAEIWDQPLDLSSGRAEASSGTRSAAGNHAYEAPATETERRLAALWSELLNVPRIGRQDDFFALGGHSLLLMRMANLITARGIGRPDLYAILNTAVLADMARIVEEAETGPAAEPVAEEEAFPAFPSQEAIWLARRDRPADVSYSVIGAEQLQAGIDSVAVGRAVTYLASRHPSLRCVFFECDGQLFQKPLVDAGPEFTVHDFSGEPDPRAAFRALAERESKRPFDLAAGPLARFHFCRLTQDEVVLFMVIDHLVVDGGSLLILRCELMAALAAIMAGREPDLPPLPASLASVVSRWRDSLEGPRGTALRDFWRQRLGRPEWEALPADAADTGMAPGDGRRLIRPFGGETGAALARLSAANRATPVAVWVAVVAALLARYKTAGGAVAVGLPFSGRIDHDLDGQVGCFVNVLPIHAEVPRQATFAELQAAISREVLAVMAYQDFPLDHLRRLGFAGRQDDAAAFDAVAVLDEADDALFKFVDVQNVSLVVGKFPLMFTLSRLGGERTVLTVEYDARRFRPQRVRRMAEHLERLIHEAADRPDVAVGRLPLLPDDEAAQVVDGFNDTRRPYPRDASLAALFRAAVSHHAERPALVTDGVAVTYAELDRRSDAVAGGLAARGVAAGDVVGLALDRGPAAVIATLGVIKAGAVYLPLDPGLPPRLLARLLGDTGTRRVVVDAGGRDRLAGAEVDLLDIDDLAGAAAPPPESRGGADAAYIMFTSGSTGDPKGVAVPHRAVARLAVNADFLALGPDDAMAQAAPMGFDAATLEIWAPLLAGARLVFLDDEALFDPAKLARALAGHGVTAMWLTASLFNRVADERPEAFRPLRQLMTGGEALSPPHVRRVMEACPGLRLVNGYGPTENTTFTTTHAIARPEADALSLPIGRPIANTRVYVLDGADEPVPVGVWGELCAAGDGLALGYAGRDDLTERAFATLAWRDGERIYRTGDIARWRDDGVLEFAGRRDAQVKVRGHRVELEAVEAALAGLAGARDAAVLAVGEGEARGLVACVAGNGIVADDWRAELARVLPDFMVPDRFIAVPEIPVSANGKKDRRALAAVVADTPRETAGRPPETEAERLVARLFAILFDGTPIDATSDFFRLGGHSLLAMRLSGLIEKETGIRPAIRDLIVARTVAGIARLIEESGERRAVLPKAAGPDFALSSGQARLWVLQRLHPESAAYNVPVALDLEGTLDEAALERALTALEERQHVLRLRLVSAPGDPAGVRQRLADPGGLKLERSDVSNADDPRAAADALTAEDTNRPFRLEDDGPARARLIDLGAGRWRLVIVLHHSVCDGWSMPILLRDLAALYAREAGAAGASLPALSRGYEDFAEWQRTFLAGADGRALVERWRAKLDPLPEPLALPIDHRRPPVKRFHGAFVPFALDARASGHLETVAEAQNATPFMVSLALVQVLLHRHSGQTEITLGTLVAGRERAELADLVGFFVNTLVLRQRVDPQASFADLLKATRATCLEALADQDCPFEALVDAVGVTRDTSRNPLFDVLVTWQDSMPEPPPLAGVAARFVETPFPYAKFDLTFHFHRDRDGIRALVEYDTDLFDAAGIEALLQRFQTLVADALANPAGLVGDLAVMAPGERAQVIDGFNATTAALPVRQTIPRPFLDQVARRGRAKAVLTETETLSYAAFARSAAAVAARLRAAGTRPGDIVALCARRSLDMLAGIHGILLAGAAYVPLDPDHPERRRADMLDDLGDPVILATPEHRDLFPGRRVIDLDAAKPRRGKLDCGADDPDALAYVIFTSGSTGRPKGVGIEHHAVLNRILWMQQAFPIGPGDVILQKTPITFDVSVWELFWWSWTGAAVALPPPGAEKNPLALVDAVERFGVTVMHFVPSMLDVFLSCLEEGRADPARLGRLRYVFASGEALDSRLVERFNRLLHEPFGTQLHNLYGPTEATVDVTWQPCSPWPGGDVVPIGKPIANTRVYVLDPDGRPLPVGAAGEIHIGGPQVARGYVNRPDLTAERFVPDLFVPGGRLYRTGDLGCWRRDGAVEYLGRLDHQVKVRGFRIECGEVERALESHAGVERAAVVPAQADGFTELHAYVLGDDGLGSAALRSHLRDRLPEYMMPARFFRLDALPLTSSGKVDRKALAGPPLDTSAVAVSASPLESRLMDIWREILPAASFGPGDGFFEAGGNSLLVIRLHERLERLWPGVFTVADLFAHPTVAEQARRIAETAAPATAGTDLTASANGGPVAIVGMAVRLAGFEDLDAFWHDLESAADRVRPLPTSREKDAATLRSLLGSPPSGPFREAAYLDDIFGFDPGRFRMAPMDATLIDPEQRLFLETATAALEDAGYGGEALNRRRIGVFFGGNPSAGYREAMGRLFPERAEQVFALNVPSTIATRLSFLKDWRGPAAVVDTACSSALVAVHLACRALANGECEAAVAGAAKVLLMPADDGHRLTIDSSTARTRAFAEGADGTGMGEGAIAFLLKPLERALADGDAIHAVIAGSAVNQDGASSGPAAPNPVAQAEAIRAAAAAAGVSLGSLSYVEAHGTGTALGDPIEIDGLTRAFAPDTAETGFAFIGSAKGNYGHLDGAAGALGLAKAVLCLQHDMAPPQPFFHGPNPKIDFARAPVTVATAPTPLADRGGPRRAGVSSFGLSGINCHMILEAPPSAPPSCEAGDEWYVVGLSAADPERLRLYADAMKRRIERGPAALADVARTLAEGRPHLRHRLALWARDIPGLIAGLEDFVTTGRGAVGEAAPRRGVRAASSPVLAADEPAARGAAEAYLAGAGLAWPETAPPARRLHLPPAPFHRTRCCPDLAGAMPRTAPAGLLGPAVAMRDGLAVACDVHAADFWPAAEHRLDGRPTLVGMALPGMLAEAARAAGIAGAVEVRDLRWLRPLRPDALVPGSVSLELRTAGGGWHAALAGRPADGNGEPWIVLAEADLTAADAAPRRRDPADLRARCAQAVPVAPFAPEIGPVAVSARWDCRVGLWSAPGGAEMLARLRVPAAFAGDAARMPLHPALLDVAASLPLDGAGRVPVVCASLIIAGDPPPAEVLVHAVRRAVDNDALEAEVTVIDPADGRVCLAFRGLRFAAAGPARRPPLSVPTWVPVPLAADAAPRPLVVAGSGRLADHLAAGLEARGLLAARTDSASGLLALVAGEGRDVALVPDVESGPFGWTADILRGLMAGAKKRLRVLVVGQNAYARDGDDGPACPDAALAAGLTLATCREEPLVALRYLDIDAAVPAEAVAAEFAAFDRPGDDPPVAMRRGPSRFERTVGLAPATAGGRWPAAGCCVVTGGLGGLALTLAEEMAAGGRVSLALLSRSGTVAGDDDEAGKRRQRLAALERAGIRVRLFACDITDRAALAARLEEVRATMGSITAVVHAAGIAGGGFLVGRSSAELAAVLAPKVEGARNLDLLTRDDPLESFVVFASLTGLAGAPGQAAYAAANAWLDTFAAWRRKEGRPALAIDWCALSGVGMAARYHSPAAPGTTISPAQAVVAWRHALGVDAPQIAVIDPTILATSRPAADHPCESARPADSGSAGALEQALSGIWGKVLGYDAIKPDDDFYALGGDSITGMQIVDRIVRDLGHAVTLSDLFSAGTVAALAATLRGKAAPAAAGGPAPAPARPAYPVAWEQLGVLRAETAGEMGTAFNLPSLLELPADVDRARLATALGALVARHEILRTRFIRDGDDWSMEILPPTPVHLPVVDLTTAADPAAAYRERVKPFDLTTAPPVRMELLVVAGGRCLLFLDIHHALADGFSLEILAGDLAALYAGTAPEMPALQFKDYAWWSREGAGRAARDAASGYWRGRFQGPLPRLDLPADRRRLAVNTWRGDTVSFALEPQAVKALRTFAQGHGATSFSVVLAAWMALIHRLAGTTDVVIAIPADSRDAPEFRTMPGMMAVLLPLRAEVRGDQPFDRLLERIHAGHAEAMRHRAYGLGQLLEDLAPPAAPDRTLLSEVTLSYMNFAKAEAEGGTFPVHGVTRAFCKNDLAIFVRDLPDRVMVSLEYYADLFDRSRIERLGRSFAALLAGLAAMSPATAVADLPIMDAEEAARIRGFERGAEPPLPMGQGLHALFLDRAVQHSDAVAAEDRLGTLTYGALARRANGLAHALVEAGVRPGDRVALHMARGREAVAAILGIVAAGAAYVPLDPAYPAERNAFILADAGCRAVLVDAVGRSALGDAPGCRVLDAAALAEREADTPPAVGDDGNPDGRAAYLMYTSGSTGQPKGVLVPQRAVIRLAIGDDYVRLGPDDRILQAGPLAFDASTFEIWGPLLNGGRICVADREALLDPAALAEAFRRFRITALFLTASLFNRQVDYDPASFKGLRTVLAGGEAMSVAHARKAVEACPEVAFVNGYGPTENTTFTTAHRVRPADLDRVSMPIGRPIPNTRVAVLDAAGGRAPIGVWGEIHAGGPGLADGYWNAPELTAKAFVPDPEHPGQRLYRTGDLGRWGEDGALEYGGRRDGQIKMRGFRIELEEIEQALNRHPDVERAVVLFDRIVDDGAIVAYLTVAANSRPPAPADLRAWLGRRLPAYMVPSRWYGVEAIPVNANGKADRDRLLADLAGRPSLDEPAVGVEPPATPAERLVADAFAEIFERPVADRRADFLDLGGHSLQAIRVVNLIAQRTGVRVGMADFFADPSVVGLARRIAAADTASGLVAPLTPAAPAEVYPVSHAQQRLYLLHGMDRGSGAYNMVFAFRCHGDLDPAILAEALRRLAERHETLRTAFEERDGAIVQRVAAVAAPAVAVDDLCSDADPGAEALRISRQETATPFDLARPPLLRGRVIRLADDDALVLLVTHHIVGDGWSSRILIRELGALYAAAGDGRDAVLPPLPVSYKDFAVWQRGQDWSAAADFWRRRLEGAPDRIALPCDRPLPETQSYRGDVRRASLSPTVVEGLHALARRLGVAVSAVGMALFAALLYRLTRQGDMVLGMGVAGRDRAEVEGLIGFFVNVLPVRLRLDDETDLDGLVRQAHAAIIEAMDRRDYPFDLLVRDVAPRRRSNRQPLINVVFEYQRFEALHAADGGLPLRPAPSAAAGIDAVGRELAGILDTTTAKHDLILFFVEEDGRAELVLEYDTDILDGETAERWLAFFTQFAVTAAAGPQPVDGR